MNENEKRLIQICFEMNNRAKVFKGRVELTKKLAGLSIQGKQDTVEWKELKRKVDTARMIPFDISTQMDEINSLLKSLNENDYK